MHGCHKNKIAGWGLLLVLAATSGCLEAQVPPEKEESAPDKAGTLFDPATTGVIQGRVTWAGPLPQVAPFRMPGLQEWPNPYAPAIDPQTRGVKNAVVFLRGVDARRARPWHLGNVRVLQKGLQLHVQQDGQDRPVGFVRQGDEVEMVSEDTNFHSLHAGGAAFFTLPFLDLGCARKRRLCDKGVVELSSAAGFFWMRRRCSSNDHPYYVGTDEKGQFRLSDVPRGRYDVLCWLPDWREQRREYDPESRQVTRLIFRPPQETVQPVVLKARETREVSFQLARGE